MARKMMVLREDGTSPLLTEVAAEDEAQLQELIKENPDLLPIDEFGMAGPLMVVGRETTLPSGGVDLVGLARSGELLVVEFKTGPQNADFRHVIAQLLDYGSDLWRMSYEAFESTVASRYFAGDRCRDVRVRGKSSLDDAARATWPDLTEEEGSLLRDHLEQQLTGGGFHYLVVAQRFTPTVERTVDYLNAVMPAARFYAVELVKFAAGTLAAFEARSIVKPTVRTPVVRPPVIIEKQFLDQIEDGTYRDALRALLETCHGLGLRLDWGTAGTSIRLPTADRPQPLTIAWLFPPERWGWMSLRDLNLGFDISSAENTPSATPALEAYLAAVAALPGAEQVRRRTLRVYHLPPEATVRSGPQIAEILAHLTQAVSGAG